MSQDCGHECETCRRENDAYHAKRMKELFEGFQRDAARRQAELARQVHEKLGGQVLT